MRRNLMLQSMIRIRLLWKTEVHLQKLLLWLLLTIKRRIRAQMPTTMTRRIPKVTMLTPPTLQTSLLLMKQQQPKRRTLTEKMLVEDEAEGAESVRIAIAKEREGVTARANPAEEDAVAEGDMIVIVVAVVVARGAIARSNNVIPDPIRMGMTIITERVSLEEQVAVRAEPALWQLLRQEGVPITRHNGNSLLLLTIKLLLTKRRQCRSRKQKRRHLPERLIHLRHLWMILTMSEVYHIIIFATGEYLCRIFCRNSLVWLNGKSFLDHWEAYIWSVKACIVPAVFCWGK
mmetsp:Transcript_21864/g.52866  ORF Transcript_21864/g.52866 Transcript_21864/m.52866 type:complete len:289 (-) Transcript_21864:248-1114(-)